MMFGLPKTTALNRSLPKKLIFDKFKPSAADRKLFDDQISRMAIVAEVSPQTTSIAASADVLAVYMILVTLKSPACDKKNIALLSKLIDQRMLFALQYDDTVRFAVYRANRVLFSPSKQYDVWKLNLLGLDLGAVWENLIAEVCGFNLSGGKPMDDIIATNERRDKLVKQITILEKRAMIERQPRRKWEHGEEIKRRRAELEEIDNG